MGGDRQARHRYKELYYSLGQELQTDYGLSVIESRALVQRVAEFVEQFDESRQELRAPGQVRYVAVAEGQPAGRPLGRCVTLPVLLTLYAPTDSEVLLRDGSPALRRARLHRMTHEARRQGGLLSYEDLALLVGVDVSTIRRLVGTCREQGLEVPSRGWVADIGPGTTHRTRVVELYFRGMQPAQIATYTAHALSSVERYLADFARVLELADQGYPKGAIIRITALSPRTVREHLALGARFCGPEHEYVRSILAQRFLKTPYTPPTEE
jgi:hypothetical protein